MSSPCSPARPLQRRPGALPCTPAALLTRVTPVTDAGGNASVLTLGPWTLLLGALATTFPTPLSHYIRLPSVRLPDGRAETLSRAFLSPPFLG